MLTGEQDVIVFSNNRNGRFYCQALEGAKYERWVDDDEAIMIIDHK